MQANDNNIPQPQLVPPENAGGIGGGGGGAALTMMLPPLFVQDPCAYLAEVAAQPPSRHALGALAGPVASWWVANNNNNNINNHPSDASSSSPSTVTSLSSTTTDAGTVQVASAYLRAASVQLKDADVRVGDVEQEMIKTRQQYEVLEAVGIAASKSSRMGISSSEILPALAQIMLSQPNHLQQASVEFLQCALLAEQFRYAQRLIQGTWPRPNATVSVKQVLRYYYLRGMIHLGCDDPVMAHRCFWACLTVPAEATTKIMIEAWKKLVLTQCLLEDSMNATSTRLPKVMPNVLGRMLASYKEARKMPFKELASQQQQPRTAAAQQLNPLEPQQQQQQADIDPQESMETILCYMDICSAFYKRDKSKLEMLQHENEAIIRTDGNTELVGLVHTQLIRNKIHHMSTIYAAVPLSKCAETLQIPEAQVPLALCQSSKIICEIQEDGMIVFGDQQPPPVASSVDMSEWIQLLDRVQRLDVNILTSPKYHALIRKDTIPDSERAQGPRGVDEI